jgi:hypothetical protein
MFSAYPKLFIIIFGQTAAKVIYPAIVWFWVLIKVQINFIFSENERMLCLSCNIKKLKTTAKLFETRVILIVFNGVICDVSTYTVTILFCLSTWIRYQKCFIRSMTPKLVINIFGQTADKVIYPAIVWFWVLIRDRPFNLEGKGGRHLYLRSMSFFQILK